MSIIDSFLINLLKRVTNIVRWMITLNYDFPNELINSLHINDKYVSNIYAHQKINQRRALRIYSDGFNELYISKRPC